MSDVCAFTHQVGIMRTIHGVVAIEHQDEDDHRHGSSIIEMACSHDIMMEGSGKIGVLVSGRRVGYHLPVAGGASLRAAMAAELRFAAAGSEVRVEI